MAGINKPSGNNFGGLSRLYCALQRDVQHLFDFEYEREDMVINQANFDSHFSRLRFLIRTANYDFDKDPADNTIYSNVLQAQFTKERQEVLDFMEGNENSKLCFIFKTHNGDWKILPFATEAVSFRGGKEPQNMNAYTFTWESRLTYSARPITIQ